MYILYIIFVYFVNINITYKLYYTYIIKIIYKIILYLKLFI